MVCRWANLKKQIDMKENKKMLSFMLLEASELSIYYFYYQLVEKYKALASCIIQNAFCI